MATRYIGHLAFGEGPAGASIPVGRFDVEESYNRGWVARVAVFAPGSSHMSLGSMVGNALASGIVPGRAVVVRLGAYEESAGAESAETIRSWPGIISRIEPLDPGQSRAQVYCLITIVDIVSNLSSQKVWGAYRAAPAAEIVGGVLSLAAGTAGKPTTEPAIPIHPNVAVVPRLREGLGWLPYAIAAGQPLGVWLASFFGLLGIRMEMLGQPSGQVSIILDDDSPRDEPMTMALPAEETVGSAPQNDAETGGGDENPPRHGELAILSLSARRGDYRRAVLLDDPTKGQLRLMGSGPVGAVVTGVEVGLDEAYIRAEQQLVATAAQLLVLTGESRQPGARPGRRVRLDRMIRGIAEWQFHTVAHSLRGSTYSNRSLMLNGNFAWHPPRPARAPPVTVPAVVDGGRKYYPQEPVPRDRLGRIPVSFPFAPMESEEERILMGYDSDRDGLLTGEDFAEASRYLGIMERYNVDVDYYRRHGNEHLEPVLVLLDTEAREADLEAFRAGEFDDPHPEIPDEELDDEQLAKRKEMEEKRTLCYRYMAWRRARANEELAGDHDSDRYLTLRDERMSEDLRDEVDKDGGERLEELSQRAAKRRADPDQEGKWETGLEDLSEEDRELVEEWEKLFGDDPAPDQDSHVARLDAAAAPQKWPPRIPLSIVQPMAGSLHGFVGGHRQGDACRVAVHDPLWAEIVGFEYRRHRALGSGIAQATAGVVVEHDNHSAWSGLLFRRK